MPSKAGRNRIYSVEERKDRNRTAQAAFRDRRNKYTQGLEKALSLFESKIKELEASEKQLIERAENAEQKCTRLESKVESLQKMVETIMADNLRLQSQCDTISSPSNSLSPTFSSISDFSSNFVTDSMNAYLGQLPSNSTTITTTMPIDTTDVLGCNNNITNVTSNIEHIGEYSVF